MAWCGVASRDSYVLIVGAGEQIAAATVMAVAVLNEYIGMFLVVVAVFNEYIWVVLGEWLFLAKYATVKLYIHLLCICAIASACRS